MRSSPRVLLAFAATLFALLSSTALAQGSKADYERANGMRALTRDKVFLDDISPQWISERSFWYLRDAWEGREFILVDANRGQKEPAFDHRRLASRLAAASGESVDPTKIPFEEITFSEGNRSLGFQAFGSRWSVDLRSYSFTRWEKVEGRQGQPQGRGRRGGRGRGQRTSPTSPDGN